jgi:hypothetical protein
MPSDNVMLVGTLIPIVAILVGGLLLAIPLAGLTLRFAIKPALQVIAQYREEPGVRQELHLLEQRIALLEEQLYGRLSPASMRRSDLADGESPYHSIALPSSIVKPAE